MTFGSGTLLSLDTICKILHKKNNDISWDFGLTDEKTQSFSELFNLVTLHSRNIVQNLNESHKVGLYMWELAFGCLTDLTQSQFRFYYFYRLFHGT